jgi:hypothetical protein
MTVTKKKLAAIATAVNAYIQSEKAALRKTIRIAPPIQSPWGQSARLEMMNNRIMMQRRVFR